jgi:hypothetical protein
MEPMPYTLISNLEFPLLLALLVATTVWLMFWIRNELKTGIYRPFGRFGMQVDKKDKPELYRRMMFTQYGTVVMVVIILLALLIGFLSKVL